MSRRNRSRARSGVAVALVLAATLAGARPGAAASARRAVATIPETGAVQSTWDWLTHLVSQHNPLNSLTRLWGAAGPLMDPDGAKATTGTGADRCGAVACADMGPLMDPNG
jgi:hypothetical protein